MSPDPSTPATSSSLASAPLAALEHGVPFADRHIGPDARDLARMLETVGVGSLEELADRAMPASHPVRPRRLGGRARHARRRRPPRREVLAELRDLAARNTTLVPMLGLGYHGTVTPPVIRRNVLEDPAWYTAYTPYQPEISQGRLEALLNFQTMVVRPDRPRRRRRVHARRVHRRGRGDAAGAPRGQDEERRVRRRRRHPAADDRGAPHPRRALGIEIVAARLSRTAPCPRASSSACCSPHPGASGALRDHRAVIEAAHERGARGRRRHRPARRSTLVTPPGDIGADVAVGSTQRFGVPLGLRRPARRLPRRPPEARPPAARLGSSGRRSTPTATPPTAWRCRPASSTSAATRPPATSAPRRCCSR